MASTHRVRLRVHGRVQGVGFRFFVEREASRLGVCGWVRNREDGTVEALAEGDRARLVEFAAAVWRGPSHAHVARVDEEWSEGEPAHAGFRIRRDSDG